MEEKVRRYSIGSLFAGIGGFELGLERAIPGAYTLWQVEQNTFCQKVLAKHWPEARIYDDVRNITKNNVEQVDILCGGFPCQDISVAGKGAGLNGEKSGLWWEMHRIINELQPRAVILENVPVITLRGLGAVLGSLSQIGYDAEWCTIRASDFGAPHKRARWFCIAYPKTIGFYLDNERRLSSYSNSQRGKKQSIHLQPMEKKLKSKCGNSKNVFTNSNMSRNKTGTKFRKSMDQMGKTQSRQHAWNSSLQTNEHNKRRSNWEGFPTASPFCRRDDGIPHRVDRIAALGNAIVPQCSEWIGKKLWESGILQAGEYNG
jgi:DNA (cytosine-5)-methyltransferase 1